MEKWIVLGAAVVCTLTGCTTIRTVDFTGESESYYRVTTVHGVRGYGRDLVQTPDSTTWTDAFGRRMALSNTSVASVDNVDEPADVRHWSGSLSEINSRARQRPSRLNLIGGMSIDAEALQMTGDTTTWFDPHTGTMYSTATESVESVVIRDGKRGTLRGLALGALAGAFSGLAIGMASGDDPPGWFAMKAGEKAIVGGVVLGVLGAPIGAVIGSGSKAMFLFRRPLQSGGTSPAIAAVVRPSPLADAPEPNRLPARSARQPSSSWIVSATSGGVMGGASGGLENAMKTAGFVESSGCLFACSGEDADDDPHSSGAPVWLIGLHRNVGPGRTMGLLVGRAGAETLGYDGNAFLFIRQTVTTFAPVVSLQAGSAVRVGLGPALHRIGTQRSSAPEGAVRHQTRLGLIADIALSFPTQTRFFVTLKAQYRHVGSVDVGPFEVSGFENDSVFPKTRISFSHGFLGAGFGIRL